MPGVTDYSDEEFEEPPPPPRLVRSGPGFGYNGLRNLPQTFRRRPSLPVAGDEWIGPYMARTNPRDLLFEPSEVSIPVSSWSASSTESYEDEDTLSWWFKIPRKFRTDDFWKHMFAQEEFFLVNKKIDSEHKEAIDTIMGLLPIRDKGMYKRGNTLKQPLPKEVNVAYVKKYLNNVRITIALTPEDRYRFEMMVMNYLMFAPIEVLEEYIVLLPKRGGMRRTRKHKSKRV
jgi:hypothetical protein